MFRQKQPRQFQFKGRINQEELLPLNDDLSSQWQHLKASKRKKKSLFFNIMPFFILALVGLLVLWYVLSLY
jgi:type VI protein secretion system component VasF